MQPRADIRNYQQLDANDLDHIERAERFSLAHIRPNAARWERDRQAGLPRETVEAFVAAGLMGTNVARAHGGGGASFLAKIGISEVIARDCLPSSFALINLINGPLRLVRDGTPDQAARYLGDLLSGRRVLGLALTEPQSGSDFASMATRAVRVDGGWKLTGQKAWATHAPIADICVVYAQTDPSQRAKGIASFLVDMRAPGFTVSPPYAVESGSVLGAASLKLDGCFVPDRDVFQQPGQAFARAMSSINAARTHVAAMCCGMAGEALGIALAYGRERQAFGKPVVAHQGLRWSIAEIGTDLEAARLLTYRAANLVAEGKDAMMAAAMAKKRSIEMAEICLPACLQVMGANGLRSEYPIARHMLSNRIAAFVDGTTEIQADRIGLTLAQGS